MKIGQSSMEFFILASAAIFFFLIFAIAVQTNIKDKNLEQINLQVKDVAFSVQDEISLAVESGDGYRREFVLPMEVGGRDYTIDVSDESVFIKTNDGKFALALPVGNVVGNPKKGNNFIIRVNGKVYLNTDPPQSEGGFSPEGEEEEEGNSNFIRGDANGDGNLDISDGIYIDNYLYRGGPAPNCFDSADSNDDGIINNVDHDYLLGYLFQGGPAPASPYPTCGGDNTGDGLSCNSYFYCTNDPEPDPTPIPTATPSPTPSASPSASSSSSPSPSGS